MQIDRQQFEETIRALNTLYAEAEKLGGKSYLEGCLACLTAYTMFLCMETHYEKVEAHVCSLTPAHCSLPRPLLWYPVFIKKKTVRLRLDFCESRLHHTTVSPDLTF